MTGTFFRPLLITVSDPSGAGKTTLCERLLAGAERIVYSVSCTTRAPRGDEVDGRDYVFLTDAQFEAYVRRGRFLEHAVVHGHRYGTLADTVRDAMHAGRHVLLDIDVQGAGQIREKLDGLPEDDLLKAGFVDIFIAPPSMEDLRRRLESRGEDAPETIERRLANAEKEMARAGEYRYRIVNDKLEDAYRRLREIVRHEETTAS